MDIERRVRGRVAATLVASAAGATSLAASSAAATVAGVSVKVGGIASLGVKLSVLVVGVGVLGTAGGIAWRHQMSVKTRPIPASHAASREVAPHRSPLSGKEVQLESEALGASLAVPADLSAPPIAAQPATILAPASVGRKSAVHAVLLVNRPAEDDLAPMGNLTEESPLLDKARIAIATSELAEALLLLGQHARRFPHGQLEEEREALWVQALVASGDVAGSRARAELFRRRFPRSIQLDIVEAAVASKK
jgi:hypothetical protein